MTVGEEGHGGKALTAVADPFLNCGEDHFWCAYATADCEDSGHPHRQCPLLPIGINNIDVACKRQDRNRGSGQESESSIKANARVRVKAEGNGHKRVGTSIVQWENSCDEQTHRVDLCDSRRRSPPDKQSPALASDASNFTYSASLKTLRRLHVPVTSLTTLHIFFLHYAPDRPSQASFNQQ